MILYYTGLSGFIQFGEQMTAKVKETFEIFETNREDIVVLWKPQLLIKTTLEQMNPELYREYCLLEDLFLEKSLGILDNIMENEQAVAICDAYYGDASPMAQMCRNAGKPVMIQAVSV